MSRLLAGVDLGGTAIKAAISTEAGNVVAHGTVPTESHAGPSAVLDRIVRFVNDLLARADAEPRDVKSLGMGVPGLVDLATGTTKFLPNLPTQWRDVPVAEIVGEHLDCPVRILNDVRTATLGELRFGHGRDRPHVTLAFFSLGTGVGGGVAVDGRLRLGPLGAAGELGHQTMLPAGPRCGCGNRGCLETLASGPALAAEGSRLMHMGLAPRLHELTAGRAEEVTTQAMAQAANEDAAIREAIVDAATFVGIAAANVMSILHPDIVVLGGGVAELGDILISTVREVITQRVGMFPTDGMEVAKSQLGEQAGVLGAIALADTAMETLI